MAGTGGAAYYDELGDALHRQEKYAEAQDAPEPGPG
jgi:hypothetical protein